MLKLILFVGVGSAVGGVARFLIGRWVHASWPSAFPLGTLLINILGCFLIAVIYGWSIKGYLSDETRLMLTTGFCGGFTTFSTFAIENIDLIRSGHVGQALAYTFASVILGIGAAMIGMNLTGH
jgi:CrcB protein